MNLECVKDKLLEAVQKVEKVTGKNLTLPILSTISISASDDSKLTLKATNLDIGIEVTIPVKVHTPGSVAVSGSVLLQFLSNLSQSEKISMEVRENVLHVSTSKTSTAINIHPVEEFPIIPRIQNGTKTTIDPQEFVSGLKSVWFSAALTSLKPELSSVYIYKEDDSLIFASTDSFRLAEKRVKTKKTKEFGSILIPFRNVSEIVRALETAKDEVELTFDANQIALAWESSYLVSRIIDGTFPDYKQIIPKEAKTEVIVLKQDLREALKLAHVFSDTFHQLVMEVVPGEKRFDLITRNNDVGENKNSLDATLKGEDALVSFNHKYITDVFQALSTDSVSLQFSQGKPLVIRGVGDPSFLYLVMPMNK